MTQKFLFLLKSYLLCMFTCSGNNLVISNVSIASTDTVNNYAMVKFDISWDNSWRTSTFESNWDASWVFIKYRVGSSGTWKHATLALIGNFAVSGSIITVSSDGKGAFIYRSSNGAGTNSWSGMQLKWNYGTDGVADSDGVEVCAIGIEMVYIPQGSFYVGDGTSTTLWGQFEAGTSGNSYLINSENAITLGGGTASSLGNNNAAGMSPNDDFNDVTSQTLPASFPKGYNAFYMMKYEITQSQYADFLNKLTYTQQASRTAVSPASAAGTGALSNTNRNGLDIAVSGVNPSTPAVYACNLNGNASYNENADGLHIACNYLGWNDMAAYLDWACLRPMTELEYEKACRGTLAPVANEYAWGDVTLSCGTAVSNSGQPDEVATLAAAKCNCNNTLGGMRVGCFAKSTTTTRSQCGASYYGVMDLSGSVWEAAVTTGNSNGRSFTGSHGDGSLTAAGASNTSNWPPSTGSGIGYRGGAFTVSTDFLRVSSRLYQNYISNTRDLDFMGRGVRTQ